MVEGSDRLRERLTTIRSLSRKLARPIDLAGALRAIHAELSRVVDVTICFFALFDSPSQTVEVIWQMHDGAELPGGHFPLGGGPTSQAIREARPQLIRQWSTEGPRVQVQYATDREGLPESCVVVPVVFDETVIGVLALQSYLPNAYGPEDVAFVQGVADELAAAIFARTPSTLRGRGSESDEVLASMPDALLVIDDQARLVRFNNAARRLLASDDGSLIFGTRVDQPEPETWPLGTRALTQQLQPLVDGLKRGDVPADEVRFALDGEVGHTLSCKVSVLLRNGAPAGGVLVLREVA